MVIFQTCIASSKRSKHERIRSRQGESQTLLWVLTVLDSHLRVRGVAGLRMVAASAMPTLTSGNTKSPTLMVAEKAAR